MLAYFAGVLALGGLLEAHSAFFIAFVVTGFLQAFLLPTALAFLGVAATSCVLYLSPPNAG
jgi:hypothetical protein